MVRAAWEQRTLDDIGESLGVGSDRVRKMLGRAIAQMRGRLERAIGNGQ